MGHIPGSRSDANKAIQNGARDLLVSGSFRARSGRVPVKNFSRRNGVMNQVQGSLAAAQFLTLHSPAFQSPSTMSL